MGEILTAEKYYTYEEWIQLPHNDRTELMDGIIYMMSEPTGMHQKISGEIFRQLANFLLDKPCDVYPAPFGVRLSQDEDTSVQPDISVICDESILTDRGCTGPLILL